MGTACRMGWILSGVLALALGVTGYLFLVRGQVVAQDDGRMAILLAPGERDLVLAEMRDLLEAVQGIVAASAEDDMDAVQDAARAVGMAQAGAVPAGLIAKLPLDFKRKGMAVHRAFDELADLAMVAEDGREVLKALAATMENCVGCHAGYRLALEGDAG